MANTFQTTQSGQGELKNYYDTSTAKAALKRRREKLLAKEQGKKLGIDPNMVDMYNTIKK